MCILTYSLIKGKLIFRGNSQVIAQMLMVLLRLDFSDTKVFHSGIMKGCYCVKDYYRTF
jgi:hypothetical protein